MYARFNRPLGPFAVGDSTTERMPPESESQLSVRQFSPAISKKARAPIRPRTTASPARARDTPQCLAHESVKTDKEPCDRMGVRSWKVDRLCNGALVSPYPSVVPRSRDQNSGDVTQVC